MTAGCVAENLCSSLIGSEVDGLYSDLVRELLSAVLRLQDEQSNEESDGKGFKFILSLASLALNLTAVKLLLGVARVLVVFNGIK